MIKHHTARSRRAAAAATVAAVAVAALAAGAGGAFATVTPVKQVVRVAGSNAIGTAIAASQENWADNGTATMNGGVDQDNRHQAQAVVLSRSDEFYDALSGSDLAVDENGPLLITPTAALNAAVQTEITRILAPGGTVYLLGGTAALSPAVQDQIDADGFHTVRLAGSTMYGTAIAVDNQITGNDPSTAKVAIVATGTSYYDALSAGGTAGWLSVSGDKSVVVLTDGKTMPAASATYLNSLTPNTVATDDPSQMNGTYVAMVGGPGAAALDTAWNGGQLPTWPDTIDGATLVGTNAVDTAIKVAQNFYESISVAAVATDTGWYDALTGGAMVGAEGGPLLLTAPSAFNAEDYSYIHTNASTMVGVYVLGGTAALPESIITGTGGIDAALGGDVTNAARRAASVRSAHAFAPQTVQHLTK
jgi:ell wall binding domain 2 (CWB2)